MNVRSLCDAARHTTGRGHHDVRYICLVLSRPHHATDVRPRPAANVEAAYTTEMHIHVVQLSLDLDLSSGGIKEVGDAGQILFTRQRHKIVVCLDRRIELKQPLVQARHGRGGSGS